MSYIPKSVILTAFNMVHHPQGCPYRSLRHSSYLGLHYEMYQLIFFHLNTSSISILLCQRYLNYHSLIASNSQVPIILNLQH